MMFNWSQIYSKQLSKGESFNKLKPVASIWLLTENIEDDELYHHNYQLIDKQSNKIFSDHCNIHLLELDKWGLPSKIDGTLNDEDIWPYFFTHAYKWSELPGIAHTQLMESVMTVLQHISDEKELRLKAEQQAKQQSQRAEQQLQRAEEELKLRKAEQLRADEIAKQNKALLRKIESLEANK